MKKVLSMSLAALLMLAVLFVGCQNLDVQNQNNPDEARALSTPGDIESLIKGSFLGFFDDFSIIGDSLHDRENSRFRGPFATAPESATTWS